MRIVATVVLAAAVVLGTCAALSGGVLGAVAMAFTAVGMVATIVGASASA